MVNLLNSNVVVMRFQDYKVFEIENNDLVYFVLLMNQPIKKMTHSIEKKRLLLF